MQPDVDAVLAQALALNDMEHTPDDVLGFLGSTLMTQDPAPAVHASVVESTAGSPLIVGADAPIRHTVGAAAPQTPQQRGQNFIHRINASLTKAICTDFDYCGKKTAVDADIKQYLPELIQALLKERVGAAAPAWLTPLLTVFGLANWQAALAGVAVYAIKTGLDHWCHCAAAAAPSTPTPVPIPNPA